MPADPAITDAPLTLLWRRTTLDRVPESYFIERVLLGGLHRPVRVVALDSIYDAPFADETIVVSLGTEFAPYLAEAHRRGMRKTVLLHLGDEQGTHDRAFYAHADTVLRNYWFADIVDEAKVHWVPNGYALGVGPAGHLIPTSARSVAGFYAGALGMRVLSGERLAMREAVEANALPFKLHWTATLRDRLGPSAYAAALGNARFALVPGGNSPETIRLYDALEMGAIPIMLHSPFVSAAGALDTPPFPLLADWSELPAAYARIAVQDLDRLQDEIQTWWRAFKHRQQDRVATLIQGVLDE